jgi:DNA invertase Pin-like site-specific DNA recombinase
LAAVRDSDTLVVTKLDRLARSVPDAHAIGAELAAGGLKLSLGGRVYDPTDPMASLTRCRSRNRRGENITGFDAAVAAGPEL